MIPRKSSSDTIQSTTIIYQHQSKTVIFMNFMTLSPSMNEEVLQLYLCHVAKYHDVV